MLKDTLIFSGVALSLAILYMAFATGGESDRLGRTVGLDRVAAGQNASTYDKAIALCMRDRMATEEYCSCMVDTMDGDLGTEAQMVWDFRIALAEGGTRKLEEVAAETYEFNLDDDDELADYNALMTRAATVEQDAKGYCQYQL